MSQANDALLSVTNLSVRYGQTLALEEVNLDLPAGELLCLLGPSGCGKSTLLRAIAGFQEASEGSIAVSGKTLQSGSTFVAPELREIGMVFQDVALFPHLSVWHNIAFGLYRWNKADIAARVENLLDMVGLAEYAQRYPHELSGGQQQRVALARAIAPKPSLLLLDEPFSGLDAALREELVPEVAQLLKREGITGILVSHDQKEAFVFADRIAVMNAGRIEQLSGVHSIYHQPETRFVAKFIGEGEFIDAEIISGNSITCTLGTIVDGQLGYAEGTKVQAFIRPDDVLHDDDSEVKGRIIGKRFRGTHILYRVVLPNGQEIACFTDSHHDHELGEAIGIRLNVEHLLVFP